MNWLEYFICAVQTNLPPLCPDDPIRRTIKEVASRDAGCSGKGTFVGAPFLCSGPETDEARRRASTGASTPGIVHTLTRSPSLHSPPVRTECFVRDHGRQ